VYPAASNAPDALKGSPHPHAPSDVSTNFTPGYAFLRKAIFCPIDRGFSFTSFDANEFFFVNTPKFLRFEYLAISFCLLLGNI
jgi:hypothetical protein